MTFKDTLCDVYNACTVFYRRPSNEDILKAATQIYIAQMKEDSIRELNNLKEGNDGDNR